jgi:ABC-type branched-subunit amino acid transport system substrate-binding protein
MSSSVTAGSELGAQDGTGLATTGGLGTQSPAGAGQTGTAVPGSATTSAPIAGTSAPEAGTTGTITTGSLSTDPKKPLVVGVITSGNVGGFAQSLGLNANFGDQRAQAQLIAKYLNARGGILGHPIKLAFYDFDAAAGNQGNAQAACAAFTEDNHAFAAIGIAGMDDAFHACAAKKGMFVLSDADLKAASFFTRFPTTIEISDIELGRKYRGMVLGLKAQGFFTAGAKVALVYSDDPNDLEGVKDGMKPALASIGITPADEVTLSHTDSSAYVSQMSSAVLKFRAEGVTHLLFGNAAAWTFGQIADKQGYYPKMGVDSRQSPGLLMQTVNSQQTLVNVWGVGYQPIQDVDGAHDPGPVSSNQKLCDKLYDEGGQGSGGNRLSAASGLYLCDELFFLHDAFQGQADVSRDSFLRGVASLGSRYQSTLTFATRYSATQHDGAQGYRPLRYDTSCSCFVYSGSLRLFP